VSATDIVKAGEIDDVITREWMDGRSRLVRERMTVSAILEAFQRERVGDQGHKVKQSVSSKGVADR